MVRMCSKKFSLKKNNLYSNLTNTSLNKDQDCTLSISKDENEWKKYFFDMEIITKTTNLEIKCAEKEPSPLVW